MTRPPSILLVFPAVLAALAGPVRPAAAYTPAEGKAPMTVTLVRGDAADCGADCPEWLALTGVIGPGTPALFSAALGRLGRRTVPVLVDSPGGSVEAAMAIGRSVRARRMTVAVGGTGLTDCAPADRACAARRRAGERPGFVAGGIAACASACVLILAAGTERSVGPNSYVGVHQMILHKTLTRVMNYFRIMRRMVNGRPVEISRTLIGTRPISSRTVSAAAPETLYSAVDRYLLGLGIAEAIMPLMRSAPPSGIHWMTPSELAATRVATDTTEARTLVARAAEPAPPATTPATAMALALAKLGDGAATGGIVDWRVSRAGGDPVLMGTVDVPGRGLHGTLALRRDGTPGGAGGVLGTVDFGRPAAIETGRVWTTEGPRLCDGTTCLPYFAPVAEVDDGQGRRAFRVKPAWMDGFLSKLGSLDTILIPLSEAGGGKGWISLSIKDSARGAVGEWEHLCCGLSKVPLPGAAARPDPAPAPQSPPVTPANVSWTALHEGTLPPQRGAVSLLGSIDLPTAGLLLSLQAGLAPGGTLGGVAVTVQSTPDVARFGPIEGLSIAPIAAADGRVALVAAAYRRPYGGFDVTLAPAAALPPEARLVFTLSDARGRKLVFAVAVPDTLMKLLAATLPPPA